MARFLDRAGLDPAFPQGAGSLIGPVDVLPVAAADSWHQQACSFRWFQRDQEMYVVGHEDIGVNGTAVIGSRLLQPMAVAVVILLGKEARLPIDAALHKVLGSPGSLIRGRRDMGLSV